MTIHTHHAFDKAVAKLTPKLRLKVKKRIDLFAREPAALVLNNHALIGHRYGYRSINITGDIRAIYFPISSASVLFVEIGTHHELYGS